MEAVPAVAADTPGPARGEHHYTALPTRGPVRAPTARGALASMRSTAAPRARPRPPALALSPMAPESRLCFSFSEEDTRRHPPPGKPIRWVALGG